MEAAANAGHLMSLAALQRQDPYINKLLDVTGQVALYNFNAKANEWEKTEIEGTLFVYSRSASPHHGFTIMNRLSTENLVEPINKDLEFQLQDPFLLYRNVNCEYPASTPLVTWYLLDTIIYVKLPPGNTSPLRGYHCRCCRLF
uniref:5'-(N(7)-methylguanosine 5'-triphospho)-[mRNA] hydrolase n=1 Tax=Periophthalmus magnuspinnatus TaxID=409849 RepID=A0A3B3Z9I7_9GOBI